jgi:hypothetical protein
MNKFAELLDNKIFVWDKIVKDMEGVGYDLFGENKFKSSIDPSGDINICPKQNKELWNTCSNENLRETIKEKIDTCNSLMCLKKFTESKMVDDFAIKIMDEYIKEK